MTATPEISDVFTPYLAGLEELRARLDRADPYQQCFGCGPQHPTGLRVRCFKNTAGVVSPIVIATEYEGPPGFAHGGIVAAYLDEILAGAVLLGSGKIAVTGELTVRYVKPVPVGRPILGHGSMVTDHGRYVDAEARLAELGSGRLLATARGRFFPI
jgi:uncharacterized protein (TIGR00369 family)